MSKIHDLIIDLEWKLQIVDSIEGDLEASLDEVKDLTKSLESMRDELLDMEAEEQNASKSRN